MTEEQVDRIVENLCVHLRHAIRVTGTEAFPSNLRELGFDAASDCPENRTACRGHHSYSTYSTAALTIKNAEPGSTAVPL
jgi:hypothetical protein